MLSTWLTRAWKLPLPIVGAPMFPMAGGRLAAAISRRGGLGMIGVGSTQTAEQLARDAAECRELAGDRPFGIGLMAWALEKRPDLFHAALAAKPFAIAVSFGDPAPYVDRIRAAGAKIVAQVQDRTSALVAEKAGVDVVVAQGTDAGGHTGSVGTLPLLQIVLDAVKLPVLAAGGIATGRGLAAVLAAGAQGAWIGTPFLVAEEARNSAKARARILEATETETVHTRVFDAVQGIPWPERFPGRALTNDFTRRWHGHEPELATDAAAKQQFAAAKQAEDYATALLYAGQSVGMLSRIEPAAAIVSRIVDEAEVRIDALRAQPSADEP